MSKLQELLQDEELKAEYDAAIEEAKRPLLENADKILRQKASATTSVDRINELGGVDKFQLLLDAERTAKDNQAKAVQQAAIDKGDVESLTAQWKERLDAKDDIISTLQNRSINDKILTDIAKSVSSHNGNYDLLNPLIQNRVKGKMTDVGVVLEVKNADGSPMLDKDGNPASISHLVKELKADDTYGGAFAASGMSGTGSVQSGTTTSNSRPILDPKTQGFDMQKAIAWAGTATEEELADAEAQRAASKR